MMEIKEILLKYWSYSSFRPKQESIIQQVMNGVDTLALLPTGGGKSICFQVPALAQGGVCIVVSPLIALMKDQVENLRKRDISAIYLISGMGKREIDVALDNCVYGKIRFLYLSPERLQSKLVQERIKYMKVNLIAIDEAHCISQWGYDFRPSYLQIPILRTLQPNVPFLALTATATPEVKKDIQEKLLFKKENVIQDSFERKNLSYIVDYDEDKLGKLKKIFEKVQGTGIVYVRNRQETVQVSQYLQKHNFRADFYHAGLNVQQRAIKQNGWMSNKIRIMVCTNAFGMGIDKSDVRAVVHLEPPESLEAYFQEAGRAGRDEKKAYAVLLYHDSDSKVLEERIEKSYPSVDEIRKVYHFLCNHFQIAIGTGAGVSVEFEVGDFCKTYQLAALKTLNALKFLERSGYVALSDAIFLSSRAKFTINYEGLYHFQVAHIQLDMFIKALLRISGAMFDQYVKIDEKELATRMQISVQQCVEILQQLKKYEILDYIPQTDKPFLTFLEARVDAKVVQLDYGYINERKKNAQRKISSVIRYASEKICRNSLLLEYFGNTTTTECGVCDRCIAKRREQQSTERQQIILNEIKNILQKESLTLLVLMEKISLGNEEEKIKALRILLDMQSLGVKEDKYYWIE